MTEPEIKEWLGIPPDHPQHLRPEIVEGMASVPCPPPGPTDDHIKVFTAFLGCLPPRPAGPWSNLFAAEEASGERGA